MAETTLREPLLGNDGSVDSMPGTSHLSESMEREREAVAQLPDLTERLQEAGLYEKFLEHRDGNRRWRAGESKGAQGEATAAALDKSQADFVKLNPTVTTFTFRRTLAFWIPALSFEGCLLFLWSMLFGEYGHLAYLGKGVGLDYSLTKGPTLVGGTLFLISIYMSYFELINLDTNIDDDKLRFWSFNWDSLVEMSSIGVFSVISSLAYLFGALCYSLDQVSDFWDLDDWHRNYLCDWPLVVGGFGFFVAGACELVINRIWEKWPVELVWWVAVLDFIGGTCFWLSAVPSVFPGKSAFIVGVVGTVVYIIAAAVSMLMWQGEQFGGAIIPALNKALREGGHLKVFTDPTTGAARIMASTGAPEKEDAKESELSEVLSPRLSPRSLIFLILFLLLGCIQILTCCMAVTEMYNNIEEDDWTFDWATQNSLSIFLSSLGNIMIVIMALVLLCACVRMPKEEPYRTLVRMLRGMCVLLLAQSVVTLDMHFGLFSDAS